MATSARKQREIQEREERFLDVARSLLLEEGYAGLTFDRIAARTEYSKGTVYQHFANKEDLLSALVVRTMEKRISMFERGASFDGLARERMLGIGIAEELFAATSPAHFRSALIVMNASFSHRADEARKSSIEACEGRCAQIVTDVIQDGIAAGQLILPRDLTAEGLSFSLWSLYHGAFSILNSGEPLESIGVFDPVATVRRSAELLLDGCGWKPLGHEWDYEATALRILEQVFPDEARQLGLLPGGDPA